MAPFDHDEARVSKLPEHSGDGYGWGGGAIVTIGSVSIMLGDGPDAHQLAAEISRRWNAGRAALPLPTTPAGEG